MACMSHQCKECDNEWFNNERYGVCPECGSSIVQHDFDEQDVDDDDPEIQEGW